MFVSYEHLVKPSVVGKFWLGGAESFWDDKCAATN